jgi:hypothetical protein
MGDGLSFSGTLMHLFQALPGSSLLSLEQIMRRAAAGITQVAKKKSNSLQMIRFVTKNSLLRNNIVAKTGGSYPGLIDAGM